MMWKALLKSFKLITNGLVWTVGDGKSLWVVLDPWLRSGIGHLLPADLFVFLANAGFRTLH